MAKKNTATKTVSYRYCPLGSDFGRTLQQLVTAALDAIPKPADRHELRDADGKEIRVIGKHYSDNGCLCGYLTSWERGAAQPVIEDSPTATSLRVSTLPPPPPKAGEAQKQYVPGVLYFAIFGNHVAFVATQALRSNSLENHLNWLLKSKTSQMDPKIPLILSDEVKKATKERIKKSHVKAITFGQPLLTEVELSAAQPQTQSNPTTAPATIKAQTGFKPTGALWETIRSFIKEANQKEVLGLDEVFDSNLEVWIQIRHPKRQRSHSENAVKLMDTLGVALRDVDGDQVSLRLADGNKISGNDLKVSGSISAALIQNNLFDEKDVLTQISSWLRGQINSGVVDP